MAGFVGEQFARPEALDLLRAIRRSAGTEPIREVLTRAPGNGEPIGGLKVVADSGWFAARPSGTEDVYKVYAESFRGEEHLAEIIAAAQQIVTGALAADTYSGGR